MSLKRIIKEFRDKNIPLGIARAVSNFSSVGSIELEKDYPISSGTEAYAYSVTSNRGKEYILRIAKTEASRRHWVDTFEEFEGHDFPNIVDVYLAKEVKNYDIVVMEKLERTLHKEQEIEALDNLDNFLMMVDYGYIDKVMKMGIIEFVYSDEVPEIKSSYRDSHIERYKGAVIANVARGGDAEKLTKDLSQALEDYYTVTNDTYDDLHPENVMISKDGTYKLIDL